MAGPDTFDAQQLAVSARDQQQQERIGDVGAQPRRDRVALQMIHGHQWQVSRQSHGFSERQADHHPAHQTRPRGRRNAGQVVVTEARVAQGLLGNGVDALHMSASGDLRHHAAIGCMGRDLAGDH